MQGSIACIIASGVQNTDIYIALEGYEYDNPVVTGIMQKVSP